MHDWLLPDAEGAAQNCDLLIRRLAARARFASRATSVCGSPAGMPALPGQGGASRLKICDTRLAPSGVWLSSMAPHYRTRSAGALWGLVPLAGLEELSLVLARGRG